MGLRFSQLSLYLVWLFKSLTAEYAPGEVNFVTLEENVGVASIF
jgi:hypothetical protein